METKKYRVEVSRNNGFALAMAVLGFLALCLFVDGCTSTFGLPFEQQAVTQKLIVLNKSYTQMYDSYLVDVARPNLTQDQKKILAAKKAILLEVWPFLLQYNEYVKTGVVPAPELERTILELLDRLQYGGGV